MTRWILYREQSSGTSSPFRFAADLNLDQVFVAANARREQLDFLSVFYTSLTALDDVSYRHEVVADLEGADLEGADLEGADMAAVVRGYGWDLTQRLDAVRQRFEAAMANELERSVRTILAGPKVIMGFGPRSAASAHTKSVLSSWGQLPIGRGHGRWRWPRHSGSRGVRYSRAMRPAPPAKLADGFYRT
jgi:hypothetical protein